jgi:hypothetical protein
MAARLNRHHSEEVRQKIQASNIIHRLQQHVNGEVEMTATQVAAANSLLDRSVAKLSQVQHVGHEGGAVEAKVEVVWTAVDARPPTPTEG